MTRLHSGDKGYVSSLLSDELFEQDVELITNVRRNMKPRAIALWDKIMLKKRQCKLNCVSALI